MAAISDLPALDDIDADYSPQYVKLARIIRAKIKVGTYQHGTRLPAATLATEHNVSVGVALHALEMLEANRYVHRPGHFGTYTITWHAAR